MTVAAFVVPYDPPLQGLDNVINRDNVSARSTHDGCSHIECVERKPGVTTYSLRDDFKHLGLDFPVSMGDYHYSSDPDEPTVISAWYSPTTRGLPVKEQYRAGQQKMLEMSYEDFETNIFGHLDGMLGPYGFDAERDIAAITLNRWPHGYAWGPNPLFDPDYAEGEAPNEIGRRPFGRIRIANSDAGARAYLDCAIDEAWRAVSELD